MVTSTSSPSPLTAILYRAFPGVVKLSESCTCGDASVDFNPKSAPASESWSGPIAKCTSL